MELKTRKNGTQFTVALSGKLNTITAPELEEELKQVPPEAEPLIMDFAECEYVSSAGLRVLLAAHKKRHAAGKSLLLTNVGPVFWSVLERTGLDTVFEYQ